MSNRVRSIIRYGKHVFIVSRHADMLSKTKISHELGRQCHPEKLEIYPYSHIPAAVCLTVHAISAVVLVSGD